jgi:hypothetical protein
MCYSEKLEDQSSAEEGKEIDGFAWWTAGIHKNGL